MPLRIAGAEKLTAQAAGAEKLTAEEADDNHNKDEQASHEGATYLDEGTVNGDVPYITGDVAGDANSTAQAVQNDRNHDQEGTMLYLDYDDDS